MKKISDMTHDEIIALEHEDIERLVDLACAEEGIPLLDELPPKPAAPVYNDIINAYEMACITFSDREAAEAVQECLRTYARHIIKIDYYEMSEHRIAIKERVVVSDKVRKEREARDAEIEKQIAAWNVLKEKYDHATGQRTTLAEPIYEAWKEALQKQRIKEMLERESMRYLELAENQVSIAVNFLQRAHQEPLDAVRDIFDPVTFMKSRTHLDPEQVQPLI